MCNFLAATNRPVGGWSTDRPTVRRLSVEGRPTGWSAVDSTVDRAPTDGRSADCPSRVGRRVGRLLNRLLTEHQPTVGRPTVGGLLTRLLSRPATDRQRSSDRRSAVHAIQKLFVGTKGTAKLSLRLRLWVHPFANRNWVKWLTWTWT